MKTKPNKKQRTVIFVAFESEFAKSGGLGAVMGILPKQMVRHEKSCLVIAPYFKRITNLNKLKEEKKIKGFSSESFPLKINEGKEREKTYLVEITKITCNDDFETYLLSSEGFFTAPKDPYVNPIDPTRPVDPYTNPIVPEKLTEDALFFNAAVPQALIKLGKTKDLILHLQDWETACTAKAIRVEEDKGPKADLESIACVLTLHNPYDRYLDANSSPVISDLIAHLKLDNGNILAQTIPLVDGPLSTVSQNFADELTTSPLHNKVFAKHLQGLLESKGLVGVDNGIFGELKFPFSENAHQQAEQGNFEGLQQEKWGRRKKLGEVMRNYQEDLARISKEAWGGNLDLSDPHLPVFFVLGRDDPRQKGYDVVAAAIQMIPKGKARYIFTPIPGDEGFVGLEFLKKLAKERPDEVKVFPFRLDYDPFMALQEGSSFMVMCSLYEPFGAATEAYLTGMPVVARATGGLVQQVVPYPSAGLSRHGRQLVALFHDRISNPTGFLFREPSVVDEKDGWKKLVDCGYWNENPKGDRVDSRKGTPLFDAMVQRAAWALQDAIDFYTTDQIKYAEMIYNGFKMLDEFSWDRAVQEYQRLYDRVCS